MNVAQCAGQRPPVNKFPVPYPSPHAYPLDFYPQGKRPLEGLDASHPPIPHPSQRQRPAAAFWPPNDPSLENPPVPTGVPFYMVGQQHQHQQQHQQQGPLHGIFSVEAVGQAAPPPFEAELMGIADSAETTRKRADMAAKLDHLTPETIKGLLLEAAVRHFSVSDQIDLHHQKMMSVAEVPVSFTITPVPNAELPAALAPFAVCRPPPPPRKPPVSLDNCHEASWRELTRYDHLSDSKQFDKSVDVDAALKRMFAQMADRVSDDDHYLTKRDALRAMLNIWDNCLSFTDSIIGKQVRDDCHWWATHMFDVLDMADDDDLDKLANEPIDPGSSKTLLDVLEATRKEARSYCLDLEGELQKAIDIIAEYAGEEEEEDEDEDDDEEAAEEPAAQASQGEGSRAQPVVLD